MTQVKKISVASVYGKIKLSELIEKKSIPVLIAMGTAVSIKTGQSNFGEWRGLMGQFRGIHPETGEQVDAPQLFLPEVALIPIEVALANSRGVEFAIKVVARYTGDDENRKPGGAPYEYSWEPLIEASEDDALARIFAKVNQALLPAPAVVAEPVKKKSK